MICFEVLINGERICQAGVGESGVLTSVLTWVGNLQRDQSENRSVTLNVGGLAYNENKKSEFVNWAKERLNVGDEATIRIVEASNPDEPSERKSEDDELTCSFCGQNSESVSKIIAGPKVNICNECVDVCNELMADG